MKTKVILAGLISAIAFSGAVAQDIEHDDMYFNSSDRAKLKATRQTEQVAVASNRNDRMFKDDSNPSDSYSARNTNPEYTSRSQSQRARDDEEDYYVTNYRSNQTDLNRWNNGFNSWYGNSWYRLNYCSPSIYGWNSPYASSYGMWGNPWANSYYGNSWNYGWGANSWWGNSYWDNYYGGYSPYYGYGYASWNPYQSYGWGYYPTRVVVINDDDRYSGTYGKRNSRSSQLGRDTDGSNRANGRIADGGRSRDNSGGRLSDNSSRRTEYYDNNWRNTSRSSGSFSSPSRSSFNNSSSSPSRSSWESQNRSRSSGSSFSPSPSRSSFDSGSSNRSSGSSGSSSGSRSSRSRGGN